MNTEQIKIPNQNNSTKIDNRETRIMRASIIGIIVNIALAVTKIILGIFTNSIAITSDAMNNFTDSSSSIITIVGTKLSLKKEDEKHPFGHGRIEYLTSMVIAIIVIVTGIQVLISSVKGFFNPSQTSYTLISLLIMVITVITKIILGCYTENLGNKVNSGALVGSGKDAKNDAIITSLTVISALANIFFKVQLDAYAGAIISIFIIKTGIDILLDSVNKILGIKIDPSTTDEIRNLVKSQDGILGAHDLIIHNYGPVYNMGSINVELDHETQVGDIYPTLHRLQTEIYNRFNIYLTFGFYSVNKNHGTAKALMDIINEYISKNSHCLGYHGLFIDEEAKSIYFDLLLDYSTDEDLVRNEVQELVKDKYIGYNVNINIDTKFI
ncbi:cation diffusion facilitator family transporter [Peptostreptococcus sp. MV1]|uniref:cation diffusion facilitator family transporter n=1 Tax=Peptostreptococcus sp. MV1 TaxID=1219626 RepID=UPI000A418359|nr:cation diffusion facilitator family transporter [Peptostreptococcus sp. MV1]